jgi:phenylalanyl-tRNA synthetase beta subunit
MTYTFRDKGEVEVLESAGDKKFLRSNLKDGLKEYIIQNQVNLALLNTKEIKVFEIGTVFLKDREETRVAYGDKKEIKEMSLEEFSRQAEPDAFVQVLGSPAQYSTKEQAQPDHSQKHTGPAFSKVFSMWSLFPFIVRDIALWVPEGVSSIEVSKIIKENMGNLCVKGPDLFDEFKKPASQAGGDDKTSYAFRLVFQSYERTLRDEEVNEVMNKITNKIKENTTWQMR